MPTNATTRIFMNPDCASANYCATKNDEMENFVFMPININNVNLIGRNRIAIKALIARFYL